MRRFAICVLFLAFSNAAHADFATVDSADRFRDLITGKVLTRPLIQLRVSPSGQIEGSGAKIAVEGNWRWQDGYFCRDLKWGKRDLGYNCQEVRVNGNRIRFTSDRGTGDYADFSLKPN